jgi:predicted ATPase
LDENPAVSLFVERARAVDPAFILNPDVASAVAAICRRLDGLPLSIELAAARVPMLPPEVLLTRLEQRLPILTSGPLDAPARQRSLRDAIAWSYELLDPQAQQLFRWLSVFVGGFTLEAAEWVAERLPASPRGVLEQIAALMDQSLLHTTTGRSGRYAMLETIREYGREQLAASGEEAAANAAHAAYVRDLAARAEPALLDNALTSTWFKRLDDERGKLRAALSWLLSRG